MIKIVSMNQHVENNLADGLLEVIVLYIMLRLARNYKPFIRCLRTNSMALSSSPNKSCLKDLESIMALSLLNLPA